MVGKGAGEEWQFLDSGAPGQQSHRNDGADAEIEAAAVQAFHQSDQRINRIVRVARRLSIEKPVRQRGCEFGQLRGDGRFGVGQDLSVGFGVSGRLKGDDDLANRRVE